jgi:hypothetical protein
MPVSLTGRGYSCNSIALYLVAGPGKVEAMILFFPRRRSASAICSTATVAEHYSMFAALVEQRIRLCQAHHEEQGWILVKIK